MQAVKMRRLKKADLEVDFFFIDEVQFSVWSGLASLSDSVEVRQHFFNFFRIYSGNRSLPGSDLRGEPNTAVKEDRRITEISANGFATLNRWD